VTGIDRAYTYPVAAGAGVRADLESVFSVPRLNEQSVACGGCCPVPAEAIILPELEMVPGVLEAAADWQSAEVRVWHASHVAPETLAEVLADISYPAVGWRTRVRESAS
jgi:hypothetical protein